jgi:hypothetical protein
MVKNMACSFDSSYVRPSRTTHFAYCQAPHTLRGMHSHALEHSKERKDERNQNQTDRPQAVCSYYSPIIVCFVGAVAAPNDAQRQKPESPGVEPHKKKKQPARITDNEPF